MECAWIQVAQDGSRAVVTHVQAQARPNARPQLLKLAGLDPEADYRDTETGRIYGGDELMLYGLAVPAPRQDYASCQVWLERC